MFAAGCLPAWHTVRPVQWKFPRLLKFEYTLAVRRTVDITETKQTRMGELHELENVTTMLLWGLQIYFRLVHSLIFPVCDFAC